MSDRAELLAKRRVYEGKILRIDVDRVRLPGGAVTELETIRHPGAAAVVPFRGDGAIVLVRQYRHAAGGFLLEVPAGKLDPGEDPAACAARECGEEIGLRPHRIEPLGRILTTPGFTDEVIWLYEGHELEPCSQALEPSEVLEIVELPFAEALAAVRDGRIYDAKTVAALLLAADRRGSGSGSPARPAAPGSS
ncbi:MAG: NUDIX hydrolase [Acidobacteria bacterium]|nr:MAG: NUDIX hydrolase [Acidobacteriota bacterium]